MRILQGIKFIDGTLFSSTQIWWSSNYVTNIMAAICNDFIHVIRFSERNKKLQAVMKRLTLNVYFSCCALSIWSAESLGAIKGPNLVHFLIRLLHMTAALWSAVEPILKWLGKVCRARLIGFASRITMEGWSGQSVFLLVPQSSHPNQ